jgi:putative ATPase
MSLFDGVGDDNRAEPLAARVRPLNLDDFHGQQHLIGPGKPLRQAIERSQLHSMILWGPPGVGKTTLARLMAHQCDVHFLSISAVLAGVKDIREAIASAREVTMTLGRKTMLFVDEAHRFNKAQQDAFLPHVEDGTILFIGATTENPSFEMNNALLSRTRIYKLTALDEAALVGVLRQALLDVERGLPGVECSDTVLTRFSRAADGDARAALNMLEVASDLASDNVIDDEAAAEVLLGDVRRFDKGGDSFFEQISALHKSVRGSSPDGALYWFARMLDGGCDPFYIARRVVRMASEDIGNADPRALQLALNAWEVQERLGSPEGELAIAQAIAYLAVAPKSNAVYTAFNAARADVAGAPSLDVPMHLRNAPTSMMKEMGYGEEYQYAHDFPEAYVPGEDYLPEALAGRVYYEPVNRGMEIRIREKLAHFRELDAEAAIRRYDRDAGT